MKIEKNKIVFGSILVVIVIFIIAYATLVIGKDSDEPQELQQTQVPELPPQQKEYNSKLDAINDLKEVRETNAPSIYDEKLLDSLGNYDPELKEKEKVRIVDSIYSAGKINYSENTYRNRNPKIEQPESKTTDSKIKNMLTSQELGMEHQLFYSSNPKENESSINLQNTDPFIEVIVDGEQIVKSHSRLRMRLIKTAMISGKQIEKNTPIYGFISFQPNRALIEIENINQDPVKLKAYDLQDGSEGIYVQNSFRAEVKRQVIGDVVEDINIPGVPQVGGIKKIFQKNNRNIKVTITNNYQLILKAAH